MKVGTIKKQPSEIISISIMYKDALDIGDELSLIESCVVEPIGGLEATPSLAGSDRVRLFLSGGENEAEYKVTTIVSTNGGERHEDEVIVKVKEI